MTSTKPSIRLLLALECRPNPEAPAVAVLTPPTAARVGEKIAADLERMFPGIQSLDLALAGALFDPAQVIRPGWPLFAALDELQARAPGEAGERLLAFGIRDMAMPDPALMPDAELGAGALRLLPITLSGDGEQVDAFSSRCETELFDQGMAGAATALLAQEVFDIAIEHARYLTLDDLCAMTAMQYEHAGIGGLWSVVEAALHHSGNAGDLDQDDLPPIRRVGELYWLGEPAEADLAERLGRVFADTAIRDAALRQWPQRMTQVEAILRAHGLPTQRIALDPGQTLESIHPA